MKKLLILTALFLVSCQKIVQPPIAIDLGRTATSTAITKVSPIISSGNITVEMNVTEGAKYSLQVTDLLDNSIKTFGFTADNTIYTKSLDLTTLKNGDYNLVLVDVAGKEVRTNIIIKK